MNQMGAPTEGVGVCLSPEYMHCRCDSRNAFNESSADRRIDSSKKTRTGMPRCRALSRIRSAALLKQSSAGRGGMTRTDLPIKVQIITRAVTAHQPAG